MNVSKISVIFLLCFLSFTSLAFAAELSTSISSYPCTSDGATILKLSKATDAHAQAWDSTTYTYSLCNNNEPASSDVHTCTGSNAIINVDPLRGYHAGIPYGSDPTPLCYSDFSCTSTTDVCASDQKCVLRLSDPTDAHVYDCNDPTAPLLICCSSSSSVVETPPSDVPPGETPPPSDVPPSGTPPSGDSGGGGGGGGGSSITPEEVFPEPGHCIDPKDPTCYPQPPQSTQENTPSLTPSEENTPRTGILPQAQPSYAWVYILVTIVLLAGLGFLIYYLKFKREPPAQPIQ